MRLPRISLVLVGLMAFSSPAPAQEKKPLVTRDRVRLNLAGAETVLEAAKKKAAALGLAPEDVDLAFANPRRLPDLATRR